EGLTRRDSWVKRTEVYDAYTESPYRRLAQVLKGLGLDGERIGFEKNYVSAAHWEEVQRELPQLSMVDCAAMMDEVRWVKTEGEIARTDYVAYVDGYPGHQSRNAVLGQPNADQVRDYGITREIYGRTIDACRPGVTAGEVYEFVVKEFAKHGWSYTSQLAGHS